MTRRAGGEAGFTLVELLVTVSVLGLIMTGLAAGFSFSFRTMDETADRLAGSGDAQHVTASLPPDVASATAVLAGTDAAGIACSGVANPVLQLTDGTSFNVVYGVRSVVGSPGDFELVRYVCTGGTAAAPRVVARNLTSTAAVTSARIPTTGPFEGASLTLTEADRSAEPPLFVFTVAGQRRTS